MKMKHEVSKQKRIIKENKIKNENIKISTIVSLFSYLSDHTVRIHMSFSFTTIIIW